MPGNLPSLSLDQFVALNDELAALTRAGVPLEKGLAEMGSDLPGRLGTAAQTIAWRLQAGESLAQIVAQDNGTFPRVYRAALLAGMRSGRLAVALEGISTTARNTAELRRVVGFALVYPLLVLLLTYLLFSFMASRYLPAVARAVEDFELPDNGFSATVVSVGRAANSALPVVLIAVPVVVGLWWFWSGRTLWSGDRVAGGLFGRLPTAGKLLRAGRLATFVEVLALLVEQQVPLAEAVLLSSEASSDRRLRQAGTELAARIEQGRGGTQAGIPEGFPPLLGWMLVTSGRHDSLAKTLRRSAQTYRNQALRLADWLTVYLPMLLTTSIGGTAVALYALAMLGPYFRVMFNLSQPH